MKIDIEQARKQAKACQVGLPDSHRAQRAIARELGHESWPKLVHGRRLGRMPTCDFCGLPKEGGGGQYVQCGSGSGPDFRFVHVLLHGHTNNPRFAAAVAWPREGGQASKADAAG